MNNSKLVIALMLFFTMFTALSADAQSKNTQSATFKVWGNCGMCKKTIENSLKIKGVSKADWNMETKMITVVYNPKKISLAQIHKKIAAAGYDTELETASNKVYNNLHGCCQYERKNK